MELGLVVEVSEVEEPSTPVGKMSQPGVVRVALEEKVRNDTNVTYFDGVTALKTDYILS